MAVIYSLFLTLIFVFAFIVFVLLFFISAPYEKFLRSGQVTSKKSKWAWMFMEMPNLFQECIRSHK